MSTTRPICLIIVFVCLLTISNFSYVFADSCFDSGGCYNNYYTWNPVGEDCSWDNPDNWDTGFLGAGCVPGPSCIPGPDDLVIIEQKGPGPCITGDAACARLIIQQWSWVGAPDGEVNVYSGNVNFGDGVDIADVGTFDSNTEGKGILTVFGGTVTTPTAGSFGLSIGSQFGLTYGRVVMYGGSISVPAVTLYYGDIALYGGTLECTTDSNFVFSQVRPQNQIDVSGGTLQLKGNYLITSPNVPGLITGGQIYSSRGSIGVPVFDGTNTILTSSDNNMSRTWGPSPEVNAVNVHYYHGTDTNSITLSWQPGDLTKQHDVYFGTSFADVGSATMASPLYKGSRYDANGDPHNWTLTDFNFKLNTNYYWRIDETNNSNVLAQGLVWKFRTHDGKAYNPRPINGAMALSEPLQLSWTAGDFATSHMVFVGTNIATVTGATSTTAKVYRGTQTGTSYPLSNLATNWYGPLVPGTTYYWKIIEINNTTQWGAGLGGAVVWTFTPSSYITIDDFEDYNTTADVTANWATGYNINSCYSFTYQTTFPFPVTPTGSMSFVLDALGKHGNFYYDNASFSEASRFYSGGSIFTGNTSVLSTQPKALRVDYIGASLNAVDPIYNVMYVAIEDTAGNIGMYLNNPNAAQATTWQQWYIPLNDPNFTTNAYPGSVNMAAVSAFHLGFGERCLPANDLGQGGDGNVMFDNIRLYAATCNPTYGPSADFTGDCYVDLDDLMIMAQEWLTYNPPCSDDIPCPDVIIIQKADLNHDYIVDFKDFAILGQEWRIQILWP
jgi:hypothetical protein